MTYGSLYSGSASRRITLTEGETTVVCSGTLLLESDLRTLDTLAVGTGQMVKLASITDDVTFELKRPWAAATQTLTADWDIIRDAPSRLDQVEAASAMTQAYGFATTLNGRTWLYTVESEGNSPPGSPIAGRYYLVGTSPTGWPITVAAGDIVKKTATSWGVVTPEDGWGVIIKATRLLKVRQSGSWATATSSEITDPELLALAGLASAANKIPYFTGSGVAGLLDLDTDATLAANSNTRVAPQQAVKTYIDNNPPLFILATGQSNMMRFDSYSWTPPRNLQVWNWSLVDGEIGTAFTAASNSVINAGISFAARVAASMPHRKVYLVQIGFSARAISGWLPGASAPDAYQNILNNITPALAAAGVTTIDAMLWWQGEANAGSPSTYVADFETVITRFRGETWFPRPTPIVVFGLKPVAIGGASSYDYMNRILQQCVDADQNCRMFAYPGWSVAGDWVDSAHPSAAGGFLLGRSAADQFLGRAGVRPPRGWMTDYATGQSYCNRRVMVNLNAAEPTAMPAAAVHIVQADGLTNAMILDAFGVNGTYQVRRANGTCASRTAVAAGDAIRSDAANGWNGTAYSTNAAGIQVLATENFTPSGNGARLVFRTTSNGATATSARWAVEHDGHLVPQADNAYSLGTSSFRASVIYAGTGTINTSDASEKDWRGALTAAELRVARRLSALIGAYRWNDAVAQKGDAARIHIGATSQAVAAAFVAEGLDPARYAIWCRDEILEIYTEERDGEVVELTRPTGRYRQGLRYDQLYAFVTAAALAEVQALGERIAAMGRG